MSPDGHLEQPDLFTAPPPVPGTIFVDPALINRMLLQQG